MSFLYKVVLLPLDLATFVSFCWFMSLGQQETCTVLIPAHAKLLQRGEGTQGISPSGIGLCFTNYAGHSGIKDICNVIRIEAKQAITSNIMSNVSDGRVQNQHVEQSSIRRRIVREMPLILFLDKQRNHCMMQSALYRVVSRPHRVGSASSSLITPVSRGFLASISISR